MGRCTMAIIYRGLRGPKVRSPSGRTITPTTRVPTVTHQLRRSTRKSRRKDLGLLFTVDDGFVLRVIPSGRIDRTTPVLNAIHGIEPPSPEGDLAPRRARKVWTDDVGVGIAIGESSEFNHETMRRDRPRTPGNCS